VETFLDLRNFTSTLHAYHEGLLREISISRIADSRNELTHRILSLPPAKKLEFSQNNAVISENEYHDLEVYEACRLTAVLYTIMIVFPMPRSKHAREYLIPLIRNSLECIDPYAVKEDIRGLYLWCLTVAGVAASGYPIRAWFLRHILPVSSFLMIKTWDEAQIFLEGFAWLRCACSQAGESLWDDAEHL
jgi:hypothetical protein